jgi:hypothetical protein
MPDAMDPSIAKFFVKIKPLKCQATQMDAVTLDSSGLLKPNSLRRDLNCRYRTFGQNIGFEDEHTLYDDWKNLTREGSKILSDFVEVKSRPD